MMPDYKNLMLAIMAFKTSIASPKMTRRCEGAVAFCICAMSSATSQGSYLSNTGIQVVEEAVNPVLCARLASG